MHPRALLQGVAADLGTAEGVAGFISQIPSADILVNNLGIFDPKPFAEIPDAERLRFYEVNVLSGVRLARAYLQGMDLKNWGRAIFISSESGQADSRRNGSLRNDEGCTDCARARHCRNHRRDECHRKFGSRRADGLGRRRRFRSVDGEAERYDEGASRILRKDSADFAVEAFSDDGRGGGRRYVRREQSSYWHQRIRGARGRRSHPQHSIAAGARSKRADNPAASSAPSA